MALVLATIESNSSVSFFSTKFILLNNFALPVRYSNNLSDISRRNELLDCFHFFLCFYLISQHRIVGKILLTQIISLISILFVHSVQAIEYSWFKRRITQINTIIEILISYSTSSLVFSDDKGCAIFHQF